MAIEVSSARADIAYVNWPAVFAGGLAAAAILFVLLTAGASIGLSLVSPYPYHSHPRAALSIATGWVVAVSIGSLLVGGYIAGRMRPAWGEADLGEVEFRDGVHGLLVWALSVVVGAMLGFLATGAVINTGADFGKAAAYSADSTSVLAPSVDSVLRTSPTPAPAATAPTPSITLPPNTEVRSEVTRLFAKSLVANQWADPDRKYLTDLVAQRSGIPQAEAEKRVNDAYVEARSAVDKARKASVLAGLVTASALLFGLLAAWYAAQRGGHQRDHNIPARIIVRRAPALRK